MTKKLDQSGLNQSKFDTWLFVGDKVTSIVYVYDIIFWDRNKDNIYNLVMQFRELGVDLEQEDDAAGFLGWLCSKKAIQDFLRYNKVDWFRVLLKQ